MEKEHISISNEAFIEMLIDVLSCDTEKMEEETVELLSEELKKPKWRQDFSLIHECYLTLSECFGYKYDNEYEMLAERQQQSQKILHRMKNSLIRKVAMF